jgi:hypothetical protein
MGLKVNGLNYPKPYFNGVKHNAYINGLKVWKDSSSSSSSSSSSACLAALWLDIALDFLGDSLSYRLQTVSDGAGFAVLHEGTLDVSGLSDGTFLLFDDGYSNVNLTVSLAHNAPIDSAFIQIQGLFGGGCCTATQGLHILTLDPNDNTKASVLVHCDDLEFCVAAVRAEIEQTAPGQFAWTTDMLYGLRASGGTYFLAYTVVSYSGTGTIGTTVIPDAGDPRTGGCLSLSTNGNGSGTLIGGGMEGYYGCCHWLEDGDGSSFVMESSNPVRGSVLIECPESPGFPSSSSSSNNSGSSSSSSGSSSSSSSSGVPCVTRAAASFTGIYSLMDPNSPLSTTQLGVTVEMSDGTLDSYTTAFQTLLNGQVTVGNVTVSFYDAGSGSQTVGCGSGDHSITNAWMFSLAVNVADGCCNVMNQVQTLNATWFQLPNDSTCTWLTNEPLNPLLVEWDCSATPPSQEECPYQLDLRFSVHPSSNGGSWSGTAVCGSVSEVDAQYIIRNPDGTVLWSGEAKAIGGIADPLLEYQGGQVSIDFYEGPLAGHVLVLDLWTYCNNNTYSVEVRNLLLYAPSPAGLICTNQLTTVMSWYHPSGNGTWSGWQGVRLCGCDGSNAVLPPVPACGCGNLRLNEEAAVSTNYGFYPDGYSQSVLASVQFTLRLPCWTVNGGNNYDVPMTLAFGSQRFRRDQTCGYWDTSWGEEGYWTDYPYWACVNGFAFHTVDYFTASANYGGPGNTFQATLDTEFIGTTFPGWGPYSYYNALGRGSLGYNCPGTAEGVIGYGNNCPALSHGAKDFYSSPTVCSEVLSGGGVISRYQRIRWLSMAWDVYSEVTSPSPTPNNDYNGSLGGIWGASCRAFLVCDVISFDSTLGQTADTQSLWDNPGDAGTARFYKLDYSASGTWTGTTTYGGSADSNNTTYTLTLTEEAPQF